jgi:hypothetical protein
VGLGVKGISTQPFYFTKYEILNHIKKKKRKKSHLQTYQQTDLCPKMPFLTNNKLKTENLIQYKSSLLHCSIFSGLYIRPNLCDGRWG